MPICLISGLTLPETLTAPSDQFADKYRHQNSILHPYNFAIRFVKFGRGFPVIVSARDAMHRGRKKDTHPTHGCLTLFCGLWSKRGACSKHLISETTCFLTFFEQAPSKRVVGVI